MKEKIAIILDDLDNFERTINQLSFLFEKILNYYAEKHIDKFSKFVYGFLMYFYILNKEINKLEGEN